MHQNTYPNINIFIFYVEKYTSFLLLDLKLPKPSRLSSANDRVFNMMFSFVTVSSNTCVSPLPS